MSATPVRVLVASLAALVMGAVAHAADFTFSRRVVFDAPFTPALVDLDDDGRAELLGTRNVGGAFRSFSPRRLGLESLFAPLSYLRQTTIGFGYLRASRDTRLADVDNDGRLDAINNVYWCNGDSSNAAQLFRQRADGTFQRSAQFDGLVVTGHGETIVAADFDNDGFLDLYIPHYTRNDASNESPECAPFAAFALPGKAWVLRNKGAAAPGDFVDVGATPADLTSINCGVYCGNWGTVPAAYAKPEGAQGIDYDEDGLVDLFSTGMLFRNGGNFAFNRVWPAPTVQPLFDEGARIIDWNNDGYPDLVTVDPALGRVHLFAWSGGMRDVQGRIVAGQWVEVTDPAVIGDLLAVNAPGSYGLNAGDLDADGDEDLIINGTVADGMSKVFVNEGPPTYAFRRATLAGFRGRSSRSGDLIADVNNDGRPDIVQSGRFGNRSSVVHFNRSTTPSANTLVIEVFGSDGVRALRNQQGRVVRVVPAAAPGGFSYTRHVDGGSGYMAQGPYPVTLYSAYGGVHTVSVRTAQGVQQCQVTPPAYLVMQTAAGGSCQSLPLPPADPVARDHVPRALDAIVTMGNGLPDDDPSDGAAALAADFNGDGAADLLWRNASTGETAMWLMQGATLQAGAILLRDHGWSVTHTGDFDGDGRSDLVWRNRFTGATAVWLMNGTVFKAGATLLADPAWRVAHVGDLDGDGRQDIVWRNESSGTTSAWLMNGTTAKAYATLLTDANWRPTQLADFNADGRRDIVWHNESTGATAVWLMNGTQMASGRVLLVNRAWRVIATGDFDGNGRSDLVWSNALTGGLAIWTMNGLTPGALGNPTLPPGARVSHVTDLDGDGRSDLVWRDDRSGTTGGTLMNGIAPAASAALLALPQWRVAGTVDLNGDARGDLVWRDESTGATAVWLMNGLQLANGRVVLNNALWTARAR